MGRSARRVRVFSSITIFDLSLTFSTIDEDPSSLLRHNCLQPRAGPDSHHSHTALLRNTSASHHIPASCRETMKICAACSQTPPPLCFDGEQWELDDQRQRRRTECIDANRIVQQGAPRSNGSTETQSPATPCYADDEDAPQCYICFEEGADGSGQPLRRDCSCRGGSAGFAHASCMVGYAKHEGQQWDGRDDGVDKLVIAWRVK